MPPLECCSTDCAHWRFVYCSQPAPRLSARSAARLADDEGWREQHVLLFWFPAVDECDQHLTRLLANFVNRLADRRQRRVRVRCRRDVVKAGYRHLPADLNSLLLQRPHGSQGHQVIPPDNCRGTGRKRQQLLHGLSPTPLGHISFHHPFRWYPYPVGPHCVQEALAAITAEH